MRKEILPRTVRLIGRSPASAGGYADGAAEGCSSACAGSSQLPLSNADHSALPTTAGGSDFTPLRRVSDWDEDSSWIPARLQRLSPWWTALSVVLLIAFSALTELFLLQGTSHLQLRAATLRAAGGSARIGAQGIFVMRLFEAATAFIILCFARRGCDSRGGGRPRIANGGGGGGGGGGTSSSSSSSISSSIGSSSSSSSTGSGGSPSSGSPSNGGGSSSAINGGERGMSPSAAIEAACRSTSAADDELVPGSPSMHKEHVLPRRQCGADLLCTLSGWVWVLLGCFSLFGSICSLLVAMGGRTAPGMLGEMFSHHGPLGRRSIIGRSLPAMTWLCFEVGSAGALYIACLSLLMLLRSTLVAVLASRSRSSEPSALSARVQALARLCAAGGAEPPFMHKVQSLVVHALALTIAMLELCLNDLPVLSAHRPLALLMGCAFSLNLLVWHARYGRFSYLYADAPRTSSPSILLACVITPFALVASFTALASVSRAATHTSALWT